MFFLFFLLLQCNCQTNHLYTSLLHKLSLTEQEVSYVQKLIKDNNHNIHSYDDMVNLVKSVLSKDQIEYENKLLLQHLLHELNFKIKGEPYDEDILGVEDKKKLLLQTQHLDENNRNNYLYNEMRKYANIYGIQHYINRIKRAISQQRNIEENDVYLSKQNVLSGDVPISHINTNHQPTSNHQVIPSSNTENMMPHQSGSNHQVTPASHLYIDATQQSRQLDQSSHDQVIPSSNTENMMHHQTTSNHQVIPVPQSSDMPSHDQVIPLSNTENMMPHQSGSNDQVIQATTTEELSSTTSNDRELSKSDKASNELVDSIQKSKEIAKYTKVCSQESLNEKDLKLYKTYLGNYQKYDANNQQLDKYIASKLDDPDNYEREKKIFENHFIHELADEGYYSNDYKTGEKYYKSMFPQGFYSYLNSLTKDLEGEEKYRTVKNAINVIKLEREKSWITKHYTNRVKKALIKLDIISNNDGLYINDIVDEEMDECEDFNTLMNKLLDGKFDVVNGNIANVQQSIDNVNENMNEIKSSLNDINTPTEPSLMSKHSNKIKAVAAVGGVVAGADILYRGMEKLEGKDKKEKGNEDKKKDTHHNHHKHHNNDMNDIHMTGDTTNSTIISILLVISITLSMLSLVLLYKVYHGKTNV